jgi:uncharacterized protein
MMKNWKKIELPDTIKEKASLYDFRGETYMVRHFPFSFSRLNAEYSDVVRHWDKERSGKEGKIKEEMKVYLDHRVAAADDKKYLRRLNLIVAQKCNSRCRYCYAGDGNYGQDAFMSPETARKAIFSALSHYETVETIQFFGGEPFLAADLIESAVEYAEKTAVELGKNTPKFSAVTNLTVLPENMFDLIRKGKLNVITSLDGPAELHDKNRIFADGRPTHDSVVANIRRIVPFGQPRSIEVTYTTAHADAGFTPLRVKNYVRSICPGASVVIVPELGLSGSAKKEVAHFELREYCAGRRDPADPDMRKTISSYLGVSRYPRHGIFCDLGRSNFTVDAVGRVWSCQLAHGRTEPIGRAGDDWGGIRDRFEAAEGKAFRKSNFSGCRECFLKEYCTSCPLAWPKTGGAPSPLKEQCGIDRAAYLTAFRLNFKMQRNEEAYAG